jgi:hypothetical protein
VPTSGSCASSLVDFNLLLGVPYQLDEPGRCRITVSLRSAMLNTRPVIRKRYAATLRYEIDG